jgi:hypothetical protein
LIHAQRPRRVAPGTTLWPASLAVLAGALIYQGLPEAFTLGPNWLAPIVVAAPLVALTSVSRYRAEDEARWLRMAAIGLIVLVAIANLLTLGLLIDGLLNGPVLGRTSVTGLPLLRAALVIWVENVIALGLCYWELGRGGPHLRAARRGGPPDFLFPQMDVTNVAPEDWSPRFIDYLYLSFANATAFSPTDTMPLTPWAKVLMAAQSFVALGHRRPCDRTRRGHPVLIRSGGKGDFSADRRPLATVTP